jgi:hypothetical protein
MPVDKRGQSVRKNTFLASQSGRLSYGARLDVNFTPVVAV